MRLGIQIALAAAAVLVLAMNATAQEFWHTENIQILRGEGFELGPSERTIVTVEHANRWSGGDVFVFTDFAFSGDGSLGVYGEITPRFSLERLFDLDFGDGLVRDIHVTLNYERGEQGLERYLGGLSADLDLPGFVFFKVMALHRDDPTRPGSTEQLTLAWNRPVTIGSTHLLFEGFYDIFCSRGFTISRAARGPGSPIRLSSRAPWSIWAH